MKNLKYPLVLTVVVIYTILMNILRHLIGMLNLIEIIIIKGLVLINIQIFLMKKITIINNL